MAILSFNKKFVPEIVSGRKRQTIRGFRKFPIKCDEKIYLYTGLRTKLSMKIGEAICCESRMIEITDNEIRLYDSTDRPPIVFNKENRRINEFAQKDGFKDWNEMREWWIKTYKLPPYQSMLFTGTLIEWKDFKPAAGTY